MTESQLKAPVLFWKLAIKDASALRSWAAPGLYPVHEHYITLLYVAGMTDTRVAEENNMSPPEVQHLRERLQCMVEDKAEFTFDVVQILEHEEMIVAIPSLPQDVPRPEACLPYLLLCLSPGVRPFRARELVRDRVACRVSDISPPVQLRGVVGVEYGQNISPFIAHDGEPHALCNQPQEASSFIGTFLEVETHHRESRSTEPTGHATLVPDSVSDVKLTLDQLLESVYDDPVGPSSCKIKVREQKHGRPGDLYIKWAAKAGKLDARMLCELLEARILKVLDSENEPDHVLTQLG